MEEGPIFLAAPGRRIDPPLASKKQAAFFASATMCADKRCGWSISIGVRPALCAGCIDADVPRLSTVCGSLIRRG
jgi:hypothetical protein